MTPLARLRGALGSLRLRLVLAGLVALAAALAAASIGLTVLFERHAERRLVRELSETVESIAGQLDRGPNGEFLLTRPPFDPGFERPLSGHYWQVQHDRGTVLLRSRSLWDEVLDLPHDDLSQGQDHTHRIQGPGGQALLAVERQVQLPDRLGGQKLRVVSARDAREITDASHDFNADIRPFLLLIGLLLLAAGVGQLAVGLAPLRAVRERLGAIRSGRERRMGQGFPEEIQPLALELDALLARREHDIATAEAEAADLAHGLKTPLQVLFGEVGRLRAAGDAATAATLEDVSLAMRRHVERALQRARHAGGAPDTVTPLRPVAASVLRVLRRTPDGARLRWLLEVPPELAAAIPPDALADALGPLAENAARFARQQVRVHGRADGPWALLAVEDDGPGIAPEHHAAVLRRGGRLDESPGQGLGLSIARDILEAHGGALELPCTADGAMTVLLRLPLGPPLADRTLTPGDGAASAGAD